MKETGRKGSGFRLRRLHGASEAVGQEEQRASCKGKQFPDHHSCTGTKCKGRPEKLVAFKAAAPAFPLDSYPGL